MVDVEPPSSLESEEQRLVYANVCDTWTSARADWELQVESFDDLVRLLPRPSADEHRAHFTASFAGQNRKGVMRKLIRL